MVHGLIRAVGTIRNFVWGHYDDLEGDIAWHVARNPGYPDHLLDQLLAGADAQSAFAKDGLLDELKKALAERALNAEMDHHLDRRRQPATPATAMAARRC